MFRKSVLPILVILVWLGLSPCYAQQNLLENGNFETGDIAPWGGYGDNTREVVDNCAGAAVPQGPFEGDYCMHVTVNTAGANFWDGGIQYAIDVFESGKQYTWAAFVKSKEGDVQINMKPEIAADPWTGYGAQAFTFGEEWEEIYVTTPVFTQDVQPASLTWHVQYGPAEFWIDAVRFYEGEYVEPEFGVRTKATKPVPADGATDIRLDPTLSWRAGELAASHDVYLGTSFDDVNMASRTDPRGVLVSEGQSDAAYLSETLAINTTYFWRIDEVNAPATPGIYQGDVWSFTTEPVAYEVTGVSATASTEHEAAMNPANTVNGSGLAADGTHGIDMGTMWLSSLAEPYGWIAFDLGAAYKLHHAQIWNHNSQTESVLGYGMKDVVIETSLDGAAWTEVTAMELPQASGLPDYAGTELMMEGVVAQHVRITASSNWTALPGITQVGLSEIRFYYLPVTARDPMPAHGSVSAGTDVTLMWRPGREAVQHEVLFSDDKQAVIDGSAVVATVDAPMYDAGALNLGTPYFWKINSIGDGTFEGDLWRFNTPEASVIDDMEMYAAEEGRYIWEHWIDGFDDPDNNGAVVGNGDDPERSVVYQGSQSLPMTFDNTVASVSEATRTFDPALDLTIGNPDDIGLYFRGLPAGVVENADGSVTVTGIGADIHDLTDEFNFVYKTLNGDGSISVRVDSIEDVAQWAKAGVMMRPSLEPDDTYVHGIATPRNLAEIKYREIPGGTTGGANLADGDTPLPLWIRITRTGGTFKVERSFNGTAWEPILGADAAGSQINLTMIDPVYIGLCVTSNDTSAPCTAVFSDIVTTGNVSAGWQQKDMTVEQPDNGAAPVYMTLTDSAGKTATVDSADPAATQLTEWTFLGAAPADLNVNLARIASATVGVSGAGVTGKIFVDYVRTFRPYPAYDLAAYYPLDGDTLDATGNGFDGTAMGDPVFIEGAIG
jgi:hypothetical protein